VVLEKLKEKTPKTKTGNYRYRFHQSLTPEAGREALKKVIYTVEAFASISETKIEFLRLMEERFRPQNILPSTESDINDGEKKQIKEDFDKKFKALLSVPKPEKDE
jgi:hypothetical protein